MKKFIFKLEPEQFKPRVFKGNPARPIVRLSFKSSIPHKILRK